MGLHMEGIATLQGGRPKDERLLWRLHVSWDPLASNASLEAYGLYMFLLPQGSLRAPSLDRP